MEKISKIKNLHLFDHLHYESSNQKEKHDPNARTKIYNGLKSLAEDAHFYEYCRQHTGQTTATNEIYFDASSLVDMLQGLQLVSINDELRDQDFSLSSWRVLAMAYRGWLGKINFLEPHYEELIDSLGEDRRVFPMKKGFNYTAVKTLLLEASNLHHLLEANGGDNDSSLEMEDLSDFAVPAFVVTYFLRGQGFWQNRLKYLDDEGIIDVHRDIEYDVSGAVSMPLFEEIREHLDEKRSRLTQSNYVDALALCLLQRKIDKALEEKSPIPVFFSDNPNLNEIARSLHDSYRKRGEIPPLHIYDDASDQYLSVIRQSNYFVVYGISQELAKGGDHQSVERFRKSLSELSVTFQEIPSSATPLELLDEIQQLSILNFALGFISSWLSEKANEEFKELLSDNQEDHLQGDVNAYIEKLKEELTRRSQTVINKAKFIKNIWRSLKSLKKSVKENAKHSEAQDNHIDFVRNELETRFGMSTSVCSDIEKTLSELYDHALELDGIAQNQSGDEAYRTKKQQFQRALKRHTVDIVSNILRALFSSVQAKDSTQVNDNLAHGLGILWMLKQFKFIREVLQYFLKNQIEEKEDQEHRFFRLLYTVAIIKESDFPDLELAVENANKLSARIEKEKVSGQYQLLTGLTYVFFLLWNAILTLKNEQKWLIPEEAKEVIPKHFNGETYEWIRKAKDNAVRAIELISEKMEATDGKETSKLEYYRRKIDYLRNNQIFFIVYTSTPEELESKATKALVNSLSLAIIHRKIVQRFRFSDTLSRYHLRKAVLFFLENNAISMRAQLNQAKRYTVMARKADLSTVQEALLDELEMEIASVEGMIGTEAMSNDVSHSDKILALTHNTHS